jgi:hypothetical protein
MTARRFMPDLLGPKAPTRPCYASHTGVAVSRPHGASKEPVCLTAFCKVEARQDQEGSNL